MAGLDVFEGDAFGVSTLTVSINEAPEGQNVPGVVDDLFQEEGITTTAAWIEKDGDSLALVPAAKRGEPGDVTGKSKRTAMPVSTIHLPTTGGINADEIQGIRAFGSETELQSITAKVTTQLMKMRKRIEATSAFHRISAIKGQILDADGSTVLLNLFTLFGVTQQTQAMALTTSTTKVKDKFVAAKRKAEDALGDSGIITGWRCVCGRNFYDAATGHATVEAAYLNWSMAPEIILSDHRKRGFKIADVELVEYYGKVGAIEFLNTDEAYLIPIVDELLITRFAPADYIETVNTMGVPFYAKQELRKFGKGVDLEAQSNPISLCTRPRSIIKLTKV